jgi:hypothetical protein
MRAVLVLIALSALLGPFVQRAEAQTMEFRGSLAFDNFISPFASNLGPKLAGSSVVWVDRPPDGSVHVISAAADGTRAEVFSAPARASDAQLRVVDLVASPSSIAVLSTLLYARGSKDTTYEPLDTVLAGGALGQTLRTLLSCPGGVGDDGFALALTADALVTGGERCRGERAGILVRPLSPDGFDDPSPVDAASAGFEMRAAGGFVAWREYAGPRRQIVVWDRAAGSEAYRVDADEIERESWDLQADGKIAGRHSVFGPGPTQCSIAWASRAEPELHLMPRPCLTLGRVRMAQDRIVYRDGQAIVARRLDGGGSVIARGPALVGGFDVDAARVAYGIGGCDLDTIVVRDLADGAPPPPAPAGDCRAVLGTRTLRIGTDRRVRLGLTCPTGCRGRLWLFGERRKKSGGLVTPRLVDLPFQSAPGERLVLSGRVSRLLMRKLGCRAASEGHAQLLVRQPSGATQPFGSVKRMRLLLDRQRGCPRR